MTAPELTAAEAARVAGIEAAPAAEEALIERMARALREADGWPGREPVAAEHQAYYRVLARAALAVVRGEVQ